MTLVKTSMLNMLAVLTRLSTSLLLNKVLAVYLGTGGYAAIGQFQNLVTVVATFGGGATNAGVVKYTAQYRDDPARQEAVWRTAAMLGLLGASVCAVVLLALREPIARWALGDSAMSGVVVWLAASVAFIVINGLLLAILNGRKAMGAYVAASIAGSLTTAATAIGLVLAFGLYGALVALAVSQALACGVTAWLFMRTFGVRWRSLCGRIDAAVARSLGGFALMSIASALAIPLAQITIRQGLILQLGWHEAGLWQALSKISETHLMLLTTTLSVYFLPRFSEIGDAAELRAEVAKGYRFVLPVVSASALLLFGMREPLIRVLLSPEFLPLTDVIGWQLCGDVLKIVSWVVGFTLVSHARTTAFIVTELLFSALLVGLTLVGAALDGLRGTAIAYALTYALHGAAMLGLFMQLLSRGIQRPLQQPA
jgi:PST family polysaccharide transporter